MKKDRPNQYWILKYILFIIIVVIALYLFHDVSKTPSCALCSSSVLSMGQKFDWYSLIIAVLSVILITIHLVLRFLKLDTHDLIFFALFVLLIWPLTPILYSLRDSSGWNNLWISIIGSPFVLISFSIILIAFYVVLKFDRRRHAILFCILLVLVIWLLMPLWRPLEPPCPPNCRAVPGTYCLTYTLNQNGELTLELGSKNTIVVHGVYCSNDTTSRYTPTVLYSNKKTVTISSGSRGYIAGGTSGIVIKCPISGEGYHDYVIYINYTDMSTGQTTTGAGLFSCYGP